MGEEKRKCLMPAHFSPSWKALVCLGLLLDQHKAKSRLQPFCLRFTTRVICCKRPRRIQVEEAMAY